MKLNRFFALVAIAFLAVGCYEKHEMVAPRELYTDNSFEDMFPEAEHITIAELKHAYGTISNMGVNNDGWKTTMYKFVGEIPSTWEPNDEDYKPEEHIIFEGEDVYIKGKVVSDDDAGNIYKSLFIQDETSGIELKLNNNVGLRYKRGSWVYVRLKGLCLGNYRMMLSIGGAPSESYNKAGKHKYYANSNIELQDVVDRYVFPGEMAEEGLRVGTYEQWKNDPASVDIITVTPENYVEVFSPTSVTLEGKFTSSFSMNQRELMFGRQIRFEGLECRYAGVPAPVFDAEGNLTYDEEGKLVTYTNPAMKNGSYDNIYPSWLYTDPGQGVSKPWYHWAFKEDITGRSLYGSVLFAYDMTSLNGSANGVYALRSSGYSRFARQNVCKDGEKATITAIYGIYAQRSDYAANDDDWATYQLTINSLADIVFENGDKALLTDEQVAALTTEDMKTVPWIDEEGESEM
ncbi:MAG: hypothetical protein IJX40_00885 [Alistipes sp.]|nr:hypothetical protein [Alistipes sp.]